MAIIAALIIFGLTAVTFLPLKQEEGTLVLKVTDKIGLTNISSISITVSKVEVHKAGLGESGAANQTNETNDAVETNDTSSAGWETVFDGSKSFDLLAIKGIEEFLGEKTLAAGKYTQMRLEVSSASITVGGTQYDLKVPSKKIKLVHPFTIVANSTKTLVLDFDASESVVQAGQKYILKPTIKVIEK